MSRHTKETDTSSINTATAVAVPATEEPSSIHTAIGSPFNPDEFCRNESELEEFGTKALFLESSVKKPAKTVFIRVHPDKQFHYGGVGILDPSSSEKVKTGFDKNLYLVLPSVGKKLLPEDGYYPVDLFATITKQGEVFLWPVKVPIAGNVGAGWAASARVMVRTATEQWIKVIPATNGYRAYAAQADLGAPAWPEDMTRNNLLEFAFQGRIINSLDHEVVKRARGEIS